MSSAFDTYRVHDFNERGRGEILRLMLVQAGKQFDDVRYEKEDWSRVKSEMPLEQIPVLEFNDEMYPQSMAIARFVARKCDLAGETRLDELKCDIVGEIIHELIQQYFQIWFSTYKDEGMKKEEQKNFIEQNMPVQLKRLETLFDSHSKDGIHVVGEDITWADLMIFDALTTLLAIDGQEKILEKYPKLKKNREEVSKQPRIVKYLESRIHTIV